MADTNWTQDSVHGLVEAQKAFFRTGQTLDVDWRIAQLKALKEAVRTFEPKIAEALKEDLGRHPAEAYFCDV